MVTGDIAASSGAYTYGFAHVAKDMQGEFTLCPISTTLTSDFEAGEYVIVVSAFGPQDIGAFTLDIESSHRFELNTVPQEGAGMFSKVIRGSW